MAPSAPLLQIVAVDIQFAVLVSDQTKRLRVSLNRPALARACLQLRPLSLAAAGLRRRRSAPPAEFDGVDAVLMALRLIPAVFLSTIPIVNDSSRMPWVPQAAHTIY